MRKQLQLLFQIQTIDNNIKNAEALQRQFQKDLEQLEAAVTQGRERYNKEQEKLASLEKEHRDKERSLHGLEEQKKKIEDKLLSVKTNKEYQAALQEIENAKSLISKREDEIIDAMDLIESEKGVLTKLQADLQTLEQQYEQRKNQLATELKGYLDDIEQQKERRKVLVDETNPAIFADYTKISIRKGQAIALAENEQCLGCSMKIPPQVYNEAVYGEKLIICPNCHRILYVEQIAAIKEEEPS